MYTYIPSLLDLPLSHLTPPIEVITESLVETWMDLESVIQSEVSQKEKNMGYECMY